MTTIKYKRRTFKEVAAEAYAKGFSEGRKEARMDAEKECDALVFTNLELGRTAMELEGKLANMTLGKLVWSRITGLFRGSDK
jgi:flagellar biosynthesis/type III secretory pathway protein FliH